jgi:carboxyl-terminal processing protease
MESVLGFQRKSDDNWDYYVDPASQIGYIRVTSFTRNTSADLTRAVARLSKSGLKGLILDLRFNPGGLLTSACEVCDLFIDDGLIVTIRPRAGAGREQSQIGTHEGSHLDFPMVVLINGLSASGSEIVAACLQDHKRAIVIGERSYGKGSVQNIIDMENRTSALKLTTATYWRPSNKNIHRFPDAKETDEWGVSPDDGFVLKLPVKERQDLELHQHSQEIIPRRDVPPKETKPAFKDRQLDLALQYLRDQIKMAARAPSKKAS